MVSAYVFGHGKCWLLKRERILREYIVIGFVDNNSSGIDNDGVRFVRPEELDIHDDTPIIISAGKEHFINMVYQLLDIGISEERIVFAGNMMPGFDACELVVHNLQGHFCFKGGKVCICACGEEFCISSTEEYEVLINDLKKKVELSMAIKHMCVEPISRSYGLEFGKAVDRHYIEKFLNDNVRFIKGDVIEVEDSVYTHKYGTDLKNCIAIHVDGADGCKKVNIETGEGVIENLGDCFICTQTLQYIYDPSESAKNIYKMLRPSGTALITVPFLAQYSLGDRSWKDYWRYTPQCLYRCLSGYFGESNVKTGTFGNIKTVLGFLYGLNENELSEEDYNFDDPIYPLIVWAVCHKE